MKIGPRLNTLLVICLRCVALTGDKQTWDDVCKPFARTGWTNDIMSAEKLALICIRVFAHT